MEVVKGLVVVEAVDCLSCLVATGGAVAMLVASVLMFQTVMVQTMVHCLSLAVSVLMLHQIVSSVLIYPGVLMVSVMV